MLQFSDWRAWTRDKWSENRKIVTPLMFIFAGAIILRITYLLLALQHLGLETLGKGTPDTSVYQSISNYFISGDSSGAFYIMQVGPGYGFLLAGLKLLFGPNPIFAIGTNLLLGGLGAIFIFLIAYQLTGSRVVATIAGLITALSPTSIALSCNILSDQPFFTFHAAAILCYILGFKTAKKRWFVMAGLLAGYATGIRTIGQLWPLLFMFIPLVLPLQEKFSSKWNMIKKASLTAIIALLMILSWSVRNYVTNDIFVFSTNGVNAGRAYLIARAVADHTEGASIYDIRNRMAAESNEHFQGHFPTIAEGYKYVKDDFWNTALAHPGWVLETFWETVRENVRAGNQIPVPQVPLFGKLWEFLIHGNYHWFWQPIIAGTIIGWIFLIIDKRYLAWLLLGLAYLYFSLITGFSFWQGSRLHYPAEMAWSILMAYALYRLSQLSVRLISRIYQNFGISEKLQRIGQAKAPKS